MTWMFSSNVSRAPTRVKYNRAYISAPRAPVMSPRSRIDPSGQQKSASRPSTVFLASGSFPATKMVCSPGTRLGSIITCQKTVFSDFTTRASGKVRWICSPRLSVLAIVRVGGMPWERSNGRAKSSRTFPARFFSQRLAAQRGSSAHWWR